MRSPIVCGIDRSSHSRAAARIAIALGRRLGRPVELLHAIRPTGTLPTQAPLAPAQAVLAEQTDLHDIAVRLETGSASEVLRHSGRRARLTVVGSCGESAERAGPVGEVCRTLICDPRGSVLVVPPAGAGSLCGRGIVCGVRDDRDIATAHAAATLATRLGLELTMAHVVHAPSALAAGFGHPDGLRMLERIASAIATNSACAIQLQLLHGPPGPLLDRLAAAEGAAMLAVGAPQDEDAVDAPSGHLLRYAARPVLVGPRLTDVAPRWRREALSAIAS